MADSDENLTEEQKQLYRKSRVPSKFCAYCGTKNNAEADRCASCGKDISWMRVPEPIPHDQAPPQAPRSLPKQDKVFTPKTVLVIALVLGLVLAFILILVLVTGGESAEMAPAAALVTTGLCFAGAPRGPRPSKAAHRRRRRTAGS